MRRSLLPIAMLSAVLGSACAGADSVYLRDDLDLELQFFEIRPDDTLHVPYVEGAEVRISVGGRSPRASFRLESADPNVLTILDQAEGSAHCIAVGAGETTVTLYDGIDRLRQAHVVVKAPNRAELLAHGPVMQNRPLEESLTPHPYLLVGGTDTFLVRYFADDEQLFGNGVLEPVTTAELDAVRAESYVFKNRDWLRLTPETEGTHVVSLKVGENTLALVHVEAVPPSAIAQVVLQGDEAAFGDGDEVTVWARSETADGDVIHGIDYEWLVNGAEPFQSAGGNILRYTYDHEVPAQDLTASFDGHAATVPIHGREFTVDSTNSTGCALTSPSRTASQAALIVLVLAGLVVVARRRPARGSRI